jgi:F420-non-reducing hydrogenase iron-sulfur subunit
MGMVRFLLDLAGIGSDRLFLRWVSASEGAQFAAYVKEFSETVERLGPFMPGDFEIPLAALKRTLRAPRLRWLTGMEIKITEQNNVYQEKIDKADYRDTLESAAREEYEKALVLESLRRKHTSVREIAIETGMPVYTVSCRLNELERARMVELKGYRGTTPEFRGA